MLVDDKGAVQALWSSFPVDSGRETVQTNRGVSIEIPGPEGSQSIPGTKFYDPRYWDAKKYWAWQDGVWKKPKIGRVTIGEIETVSRVPQTAPEVDAPAPEVTDPAPVPTTP